MKKIRENELYENMNRFLKAKGIELTAGSYARVVQRGCSLLTDAINLGQRGIRTVGTEVNEKVEQMRQCIHEATAPKGQAAAPTAKPPPVAQEPAAKPRGTSKSTKAAPNRRRAKKS